MKLHLSRVADSEEPGQIVVRLLLLNDSFEPVTLDRRLLVGPNPVPSTPTGLPLPISMEPPADEEAGNLVVLNPWCLYGRERTFDAALGTLTFHGYLLRQAEDELRAAGPVRADAAELSAEPLTIAGSS